VKVTEIISNAGKPLVKYKYLLLVILAGLVILLWPRGTDPPDAAVLPEPEAFDLQAMEERLAETLSAIRGVGNAKVMLTLKTDMEVVVVQDTNVRSHREMEGDRPQTVDDERQTETVLAGSSGSGSPIIAKRIYPQYQGALVVCEGAGDVKVQMAVLEAVAALTGLRSDAVTVVLAGE
jgi:stage III sporulation protein AG